MIKQVLKIIWKERNANLWLLLELIVVFCILWFCTDYLYFMGKRYLQPKGFDIENTYRIQIGRNKKNIEEYSSEQQLEYLWKLHDRVTKHPEVELAAYSVLSYPYASYTGNEYLVDSVKQMVTDRLVSPEYFNVFKLNIIYGKAYSWEDVATGNKALISSGKDNLFAEKEPESIKSIENNNTKYKISGVVQRTKQSEYDDYKCTAYIPLKKSDEMLTSFNELSVRVKPEADRNFPERFIKDMRSQFQLGPYYLASVTSTEKERQHYMEIRGYADNFNSIYAVSGFLFANIFLGVIGTFWFRTKVRRGEIGLRRAMGASKKQIRKMFLTEVTIMLVLSSALASLICINISLVDIVKDIGVPVIDQETSNSFVQYIINYLLTFSVLMLISFVAVLYPANKASKVAPTDALRNE